MDLIGQLSSQFGIDTSQAEGLAGGLLGAVKDQVAEKVGESEASELAEHVPEMGDWQAKAASLAGGDEGGGGGLMGLAGSAMGALGGGGGVGGFAALLPMLSNMKLDASSLSSLLPMGLEFLKSRLPGGLMGKVAGAIPALSGEEESSGGLGGLVGSLLGK